MNYFLIVFHSQKHSGLIIGSTLTLDIHVKSAIAKVNKTIGPIQNLRHAVFRPSVVAICKAFIKPHLDYGETIFDYAFNDFFRKRMESVKYDAALAVVKLLENIK